ncbi:hypothetical protein [Shewanella nanhaiensis]|uniref:Uncharacterized protein n=1 Tax=Shewanella nanhaiensis TaxID=2864872 RepID=A0ABS7E233_9GAMM|nr:hypothetical protein [Shewanella nanhaiensis]MBW8183719.1 hypothetical protein [Shewanella nanhaiensis]
MNLNNPPIAFTITRLDTPLGIIRATGQWAPNTPTVTGAKLFISTFDIMGTDGWVALDIKLPKTSALINELNDKILHHLQTR